MKIDIGCGYNKQPGYIGIDRFETPDTKIVCDINVGIPLEDNSVEYVMASHSLEHIEDLMYTMEEIYRICKHKAIVCIAAPYYNTSLNAANPYHKQVFNEHTARFFTSDPFSIIPKEQYYFPHAQMWGLGSSDNSNLKIDLRCLKMECFYFPEYRKLDESEKIKLRQSSLNIVDQILIHLVVVKEEISMDELYSLSQAPLEEPNHVTIRRFKEKYEDAMNELEILKQDDELRKGKINELSQELLHLQNTINAQEFNGKLADKLAKQIGELKEISSKNAILHSLLEKDIENIESNKVVTILEKPILTSPNAKADQKNYELWSQRELEKGSKWNKIGNRIRRIRNKKYEDLSAHVNDYCIETINHSIIQAKTELDDYVLNLGDPILNNEIVYYTVSPTHNNWNGIECIFTNLISDRIDEYLAFEVLNEEHQILRTVILDSHWIKHNEPTTIHFEDIENSGNKKFIVRFMGMSPLIWGVQLYEWVLFNRFGKKSKSVFAGRLL